MSDRGYQIAPLPVGPYSITLGPGETLNATFRMWSRDWGRLVLLAAIPLVFMLPLLIAAGGVAFVAFDKGGDPSLGTMIAVGGFGAIGVLVGAIGYLAAIGGIIASVDERERTGQNALTVWQAFLHGLSRSGRLFGASVVLFGILSVWGGFIAAPLFLMRDGSSAGALFLIPAVLLAPVVVWLMLRLAALWVVVVVEDVSFTQAFSRSFELSRGQVGTIFVCGLVYGVVIFGISMAGGILGLIPLLGVLVQIALNLVTTSLGPVWQFALYAGLVKERS